MRTELQLTNDAPRWFLSVEGQTRGPYSEAEIWKLLQGQQITAGQAAVIEGQSDWKPLYHWPQFRSLAPTAVVAHAGAPPRSVWNPRTLAWLTLLFTPLWGGVIGCINACRLGKASTAWVPLTLGAIWLLLDYFGGRFCSWSLWPLALYGGAVGLMWAAVFEPQYQAYTQALNQGRTSGRWLFPYLAGVPLTVLLLIGLTTPWRLTPLECCRNFLNAKNIDEQESFATTRLWPAMEKWALSPEMQMELTLQDQRIVDSEHSYVNFQVKTRSPKPETGSGYFEMINTADGWKIDDIRFADPVSAGKSLSIVALDEKSNLGLSDEQWLAAAQRDGPSPRGRTAPVSMGSGSTAVPTVPNPNSGRSLYIPILIGVVYLGRYLFNLCIGGQDTATTKAGSAVQKR